jgi:hypothetical protein
LGVSNYCTLGGSEPNQPVSAPRVMHGVDGVVSAAASPSVLPRQVADLADARKVVRGVTNAPEYLAGPLAIKSDGTVWRITFDVTTVMGSSGSVQTFSGRARQLAGLAGVVDISCGVRHCLALLSSGTLVGWGNNSAAELGTFATSGTLVETPVAVSGLTDVVSVGAALALTDRLLAADPSPARPACAWSARTMVLMWAGRLGDAENAAQSRPRRRPLLAARFNVGTQRAWCCRTCPRN